MLTCLSAPSPVIHAALLGGSALPREGARVRDAVFSGAEALRLGTRERFKALENSEFWRALLHPELDLPSYGALLQQLASIWPPISRALRERAMALDCADWLPAPATARLQADLACLRRMGHAPANQAPRRVDLARGDEYHLLGMAAVISELQAQGVRVARHVDARLGLGGEARSFFQPAGDPPNGLLSPHWSRLLDVELCSRSACESAIRGGCELLDSMHHHLRSAWVLT